MDTNQWPQVIGLVKPIIHHQESSSPPKGNNNLGGDQRKARPQKEQALNCPRCNSTNTKFCYYNNYSLTQPRYFCKTCRRYWTEGGTLRNVPVGGGSRKNKRSSSASSISSPQAQKIIKNPNSDLISQIPSFSQNPSKIHEGHDLNLAYHDHDNTTTTTTSGLLGLNYLPYPINNNGAANPSLSGISPKTLSSLMAMPNLYSPSLLHMQQDYSNKPKLNNFCLDGFDHADQNGYSSAAKLFLPNYEDLKPHSMSEQFEQRQPEQGGGGGGQGGGGGGGEYWSGGMIGGGSW